MQTLQQRVDALIRKHPKMKKAWNEEGKHRSLKTQEMIIGIIEDLDAMPWERRSKVIERAKVMLAEPN